MTSRLPVAAVVAALVTLLGACGSTGSTAQPSPIPKTSLPAASGPPVLPVAVSSEF